jgi:hypothetical protein
MTRTRAGRPWLNSRTRTAAAHSRWSQPGSPKCSLSRLTACSSSLGVRVNRRAALVNWTEPVQTIPKVSSATARNGRPGRHVKAIQISVQQCRYPLIDPHPFLGTRRKVMPLFACRYTGIAADASALIKIEPVLDHPKPLSPLLWFTSPLCPTSLQIANVLPPWRSELDWWLSPLPNNSPSHPREG